MTNPVIAVDFDDCVKPFDLPFREDLHKQHDIDLISVKAVEGKYHYDEAYPDSGVSPEQFEEYINDYIRKRSIDTAPYEGAAEALGLLAAQFELHIVTARPPEFRQITEVEIEKGLGTGIIAAVHTAEFNGDHKMTSKVSMYNRIGAIAAIDDADHNVNSAIEAGLVGISLQYPGHTHNGHSLREGAIVVRSLGEILEHTGLIKAHVLAGHRAS